MSRKLKKVGSGCIDLVQYKISTIHFLCSDSLNDEEHLESTI